MIEGVRRVVSDGREGWLDVVEEEQLKWLQRISFTSLLDPLGVMATPIRASLGG